MTTLQLEPSPTLEADVFEHSPSYPSQDPNGRVNGNGTHAKPFDIPSAINEIITEDDTPVDNLFSEKQQRLLTSSLYDSAPHLTIPQPFLVAANVGVFFEPRQPPIVPDIFLSLGVKVHEDWYAKAHRTYFIWEFGKVPELVIEIVSNKVGKEDEDKLTKYARRGISYYVLYDPTAQLSDEPLRGYELTASSGHRRLDPVWFSQVGLGIRLWSGEFEGVTAQWMRWYDDRDQLVPTGGELAAQERQARLLAEQQVEQEQKENELLRQKLAEYEAQLKALGIS